MRSLERVLGRRTEPRCSICGTTHSQIVAKAQALRVPVTGKGVGVCPTCRRAFCVDHMIQGDPHDFFDNDKCPNDRANLDLDWDEPPTPDAPWRFGARPRRDAGVLAKRLRHGDSEVRINAAEALGELGDRRAVEPLLQSLEDVDSRVRSAAAEALGELADRRAVEPLLQSLEDVDSWVRSAAAEALGKLKDPRGLDPLLRALEDVDVRVRRTAAEALGKLRDPRALDPLLRALTAEDYEIVDGAARGLSELGDPRAVEPLIEVLQHRQAAAFQVPAVEALGRLNDQRAVDALVAALRDSPVSGLAAKALAHIGGPEAERALAEYRAAEAGRELAAAETERAREEAAQARAALKLARLSELPKTPWAPHVANLADEDPAVRHKAEQAFESLANPDAIDELVPLLGHPDAGVVAAAARVLTRLGDARGSAWILIDAARRDIRGLYDRAARNLERAGADAVPLLRAAAHDDSAAVRWSVAHVLGRSGAAEAVPLLIELLDDADEGVREVALAGLEGIGGADAQAAIAAHAQA